MKGLTTLRDLLRHGDWLIKVDLKDAYFTVPVHPDHQCYLRFSTEGVNYQFTCLPFGLTCAPWAFTKIMKAVVALLRSWGTRMVIYINDILIISESAVQAGQHLEVLTHILQSLDFIINTEKLVMTPNQELEFLGKMVNTNTLLVSLPADKVKQIRAEAVRISNMNTLSTRLLSHFLGKLSAATQAIPPAPLFYRCLQRDLQAALADNDQNYEAHLTLSQASLEELSWWREHLSKWNGKPLKQKPEHVTISSDASQMGWGTTCAETRTGGAWSVQEQAMHINSLELLAATLAVTTFLKHASGISVLLQLDNATAVAYINNIGGTVSCQLIGLAKELWMWALDRDIALSAQHIPGVSNTIADIESQTVRLDALPMHISSHHGSLQAAGRGPICFQTDIPDTSLLQLEWWKQQMHSSRTGAL